MIYLHLQNCELLVNFADFLFIAHVYFCIGTQSEQVYMKAEGMDSANTAIPGTSVTGMRKRHPD